jgi:hypothetical protein
VRHVLDDLARGFRDAASTQAKRAFGIELEIEVPAAAFARDRAAGEGVIDAVGADDGAAADDAFDGERAADEDFGELERCPGFGQLVVERGERECVFDGSEQAAREVALLEAAANDDFDLVVPRLADLVGSVGSEEGALGAFVDVAREEDADGVALVQAGELEDFDAVVVGHLEIADHDVVLVGHEHVERFVAAGHRFDAVVHRQLVDEGFTDVVVVVHDEDAGCRLAHGTSLRGAESRRSTNVDWTFASSGRTVL